MKRQANFEILRVVAMAMIVAMHFMQRSGIIRPLSEDLSVVNLLAWFMESACIVAANCYVLIAGYFLVDSEWKMKKLLRLVMQVFFYSLGIPLVCLIVGVGDVSSWSVYDWVTAVLPLQTDHYWFATAYVLMFMLSPVLAAGVKQLSKKQLEITIGVLLLYFCVIKSISPVLLATDKYGYDYPWFICLFLIAAYIKLYGNKQGVAIGRFCLFASAGKSAAVYALITLVTFGGSVVLTIVDARIGKLDYFMDMMFSYNHILTLLASLAFFFTFKNWQPKEGKAVRFLCRIAPYTFGVYLIHENVAIRHLWTGWFQAENVQNSLLFAPYMILVIVCLFAMCMTIDYIRTLIFKKVFQ